MYFLIAPLSSGKPRLLPVLRPSRDALHVKRPGFQLHPELHQRPVSRPPSATRYERRECHNGAPGPARRGHQPAGEASRTSRPDGSELVQSGVV